MHSARDPSDPFELFLILDWNDAPRERSHSEDHTKCRRESECLSKPNYPVLASNDCQPQGDHMSAIVLATAQCIIPGSLQPGVQQPVLMSMDGNSHRSILKATTVFHLLVK